LPKSVFPDINLIHGATLHVRVWGVTAGVGVSLCVTETILIWQNKGVLTTQTIENDIREHVWDIAQSMSFVNKQVAGPNQWDFLNDHCITWTSNLVSKRPLRKPYMALS
jgi:hypothetical protein